MTTQKTYLGIDVGTGSARAGVFNASGKLLASAKRPIDIWHEAGEVVEQSSDQIWSAICESVRDAVSFAGVASTGVMGVGFDATCSLVAVKADGKPVAVGPSGNAKRNIMVWMDHRAAGEAEEINSGGHSVLRYVGGRISPEMETPKLLWLKRNLPESFSAADYFFDLADYLTWRATGSLDRSICTVTCKWTYLAHEKRWDAHYFDGIGLGELAAEGFTRIGTNIVEPGVALVKGLTNEAAADLGLQTGTPVGASLIDAHAGGVGTLGGQIKGLDIGVQRRLAYIFGTSACSMASSETCIFVDGVWGPYYSAMIPGLWLNEGGQSAAGAAIDHLVQMHPASGEATKLAATAGLSLVVWIEQQVTAKYKYIEKGRYARKRYTCRA
jgi:D-ribulokinase